MANLKDVRNSKPVKITLSDGNEYTVRFTLNAMAELEDKYGSVDAAFKKLDEGSMKAARFILWAGLSDGYPDLTEQQVGALIDVPTMVQMMDTLGIALGQDMPDPSVATEAKSDPNA